MSVTIVINGSLGKDPELSYTKNQTARAKFSIASSNKQGDKWLSKWYYVSVWGKQAEYIAGKLTKGCKALVIGELLQREYKNKQGQMVQASEVNANKVELLAPAKNQQQNNQQQQQHNQQQNQQHNNDDIPF